MKQTYENAIKIINGSKSFTFDGSVLEITGYYTGDSVKLDLSKLTPEMFDVLRKDEPRRAVWLRCKENIEDFDQRALRALGIMDRDRCLAERADRDLTNEILEQIDDYCYDEGLDADEDIDFCVEDIMLFVDD